MGNRVMIASLILVVWIACVTAGGRCDVDLAILQDQVERCLADDVDAHERHELTEILQLQYWTQLCSQYGRVMACVQLRYPDCDQDHMDMFTLLSVFERREAEVYRLPYYQMVTDGCTDGHVSSHITQVYDRAGPIGCLSPKTRSSVTSCLMTWLHERSAWPDVAVIPERRASLVRYGRATFQCVLNLVRAKCPLPAQDVIIFAINQTVPQDIRHQMTRKHVVIPLNQTYVVSTLRSSVGFYGNTHLLVYTMTSPVTCNLRGDVTFLSNQLFSVRGATGRKNTGVSELEIEFYRPGGGAIGGYIAGGGRLPVTFDTDEDTLSTLTNPIQIQYEDGLIRINSSARAYIMLIQYMPSGYTFTLRVSEGVLKTSTGLLVHGCSYTDNQLVHVPAVIEAHGIGECGKPCESLQVPIDDLKLNFTEACLYDCIVATRNTNDSTIFESDVHESYDFDTQLSLVEPPPEPGQAIVNGVKHVSSCQVLIGLLVLVTAGVGL